MPGANFATASETKVINEDAMAIVCLREKNIPSSRRARSSPRRRALTQTPIFHPVAR